MSLQEQRKNRINELKRLKRKGIDKEKLVAFCALEWGTSRRTVLEYLKIIELTQ